MLQDFQLTNFRFVFASSIITISIFVFSLITLSLFFCKKLQIQNLLSNKKQFFLGSVYFMTFVVLIQFIYKSFESKDNIIKLNSDYAQIIQEVSYSNDVQYYMGLKDVQIKLEYIKNKYNNFVDFFWFYNDSLCEQFQNFKVNYNLKKSLSNQTSQSSEVHQKNQITNLNFFISQQYKACKIVQNFDMNINLENIFSDNVNKMDKVIRNYIYFDTRITNIFKVFQKQFDNFKGKNSLITLSVVMLSISLMVILYYWNFVNHIKIKKFCFLFGFIFLSLFLIQLIVVLVYIALNVSGNSIQKSIQISKNQSQKQMQIFSEKSYQEFDDITQYLQNLKQNIQNNKEMKILLHPYKGFEELTQYYTFFIHKIDTLKSFKQEIINLSDQVYNSNSKEIQIKQLETIQKYIGEILQNYLVEIFVITVLLGVLVKIQIFFKLYNQIIQM